MDNLWSRRSTSNSKLSLSTPSNGVNGSNESAAPGGAGGRGVSFSKRVGAAAAAASGGGDAPGLGGGTGGFGGKMPVPLSATTPGGGSTALPSPGAAAFGLGSGAFASFGTATTTTTATSAKTPKTPGNPFDFSMGQVGARSGGGGPEKGGAAAAAAAVPTKEKVLAKAPSMAAISETESARIGSGPHSMRHKWVFWWRPPIVKGQAGGGGGGAGGTGTAGGGSGGSGFIDYEKTIHAMCRCSTVEELFAVYGHLKRPSALPTMSEYHFFKHGIRPIWEDEVNKEGGKWVVRVRKGVADRYWELLVLAMAGDQFGDAGDEVCGAVVSVRNGEDIISIWTRNSGGRVLKIREIMKQVLQVPPNTRIEFKSHDSAMQQRAAVEESRHKNQHHHHQQHHRDDKRGSGGGHGKPYPDEKKNANLAS